MRLAIPSILLISSILAGCATPEEIAAARAADLARTAAEDDGLCRRAGFSSGTEQYRLCRHQRTEERATAKAYEIARRAKEDEKRRKQEEEEREKKRKDEEECKRKKQEAEDNRKRGLLATDPIC